MWQDPNARYRFKLHHCEADNHYHILIGIDVLSWPFWSREAGRKLIDFSLGRGDMAFGLASPEAGADLEFHVAEFERLREEIERLSVKSETMLPEDGNIAMAWVNFLNGTAPYVCYATPLLGTTFVFPLVCDFVQRATAELPERLDRTAWARLAEAPATRLRMEDLGITLEPA